MGFGSDKEREAFFAKKKAPASSKARPAPLPKAKRIPKDLVGHELFDDLSNLLEPGRLYQSVIRELRTATYAELRGDNKALLTRLAKAIEAHGQSPDLALFIAGHAIKVAKKADLLLCLDAAENTPLGHPSRDHRDGFNDQIHDIYEAITRGEAPKEFLQVTVAKDVPRGEFGDVVRRYNDGARQAVEAMQKAYREAA